MLTAPVGKMANYSGIGGRLSTHQYLSDEAFPGTTTTLKTEYVRMPGRGPNAICQPLPFLAHRTSIGPAPRRVPYLS